MAVDKHSYRNRKNKSGLLYFVLTIIFVLLMVKWGVPFFVNLVAGPTTTKGNLTSGDDDNVPPQTPIISALPEATNSARIRVEGFTEPKVEVSLWRNEEMFTTAQSGDSGSFGFDLDLSEGANRIYVKAKDEPGNESESIIKTVVYDRSEIVIIIESPADNSEIFGKINQNLTVIGKVSEPKSSVSVNGSFARVDAAGKFSATIRLAEGDNTVVIRATGRAGNVAEKTIYVKLTF